MLNMLTVTFIILGAGVGLALLTCIIFLLSPIKRSDDGYEYEQEPIDEDEDTFRLYDILTDYIDQDTLEDIENEVDSETLSDEDKTLLDNLLKALHDIFDEPDERIVATTIKEEHALNSETDDTQPRSDPAPSVDCFGSGAVDTDKDVGADDDRNRSRRRYKAIVKADESTEISHSEETGNE